MTKENKCQVGKKLQGLKIAMIISNEGMNINSGYRMNQLCGFFLPRLKNYIKIFGGV